MTGHEGRAVSPQDRRLQSLLREAQSDLDHGRARRAVRKLWSAANISVYRNSEPGLEATTRLARLALSAASGRVREDAQRLCTYCENCLSDVRRGVTRKRSIAELFRLGAPEPMKTCPECAEKVKEAALVCRFCRHRFD